MGLIQKAVSTNLDQLYQNGTSLIRKQKIDIAQIPKNIYRDGILVLIQRFVRIILAIYLNRTYLYTLHSSGITPIFDPVTDVDLFTEFDFLLVPNCARFHGTFSSTSNRGPRAKSH